MTVSRGSKTASKHECRFFLPNMVIKAVVICLETVSKVNDSEQRVGLTVRQHRSAPTFAHLPNKEIERTCAPSGQCPRPEKGENTIIRKINSQGCSLFETVSRGVADSEDGYGSGRGQGALII